MNVNNGTIQDLTGEEVKALGSSDFVKVDRSDMTETQKENQKVSLYDRRSKLGKKLTSERKKRKLGRGKIYN